jgi:hypothetical protein
VLAAHFAGAHSFVKWCTRSQEGVKWCQRPQEGQAAATPQSTSAIEAEAEAEAEASAGVASSVVQAEAGGASASLHSAPPSTHHAHAAARSPGAVGSEEGGEERQKCRQKLRARDARARDARVLPAPLAHVLHCINAVGLVRRPQACCPSSHTNTHTHTHTHAHTHTHTHTHTCM